MKPFKSPKLVKARHERMVVLASRTGADGRGPTLKEIALRVGLHHPSSVGHHLMERCRCAQIPACEHEYQMLCKHCGARQ